MLNDYEINIQNHLINARKKYKIWTVMYLSCRTYILFGTRIHDGHKTQYVHLIMKFQNIIQFDFNGTIVYLVQGNTGGYYALQRDDVKV